MLRLLETFATGELSAAIREALALRAMDVKTGCHTACGGWTRSGVQVLGNS